MAIVNSQEKPKKVEVSFVAINKVVKDAVVSIFLYL